MIVVVACILGALVLWLLPVDDDKGGPPDFPDRGHSA